MDIPVHLPGAILCVVVGKPIAHSRSPVIHRLFAEQFQLPLQYERLLVEPGFLSAAVGALRRLACRGVNVTVPLKAEAASLADIRTDAVELAGAANTLWWSDTAKLVADNTDGIGLIQDLSQNLGMRLGGARILILGAGGAAAGVIGPLLASGPALICVVNRRVERAEALVTRFRTASALTVLTLPTRLSAPFDLIINATSAGLSGEVPDFPREAVGPQTLCYDMFYAEGETAFMRHCRAMGAERIWDGFGMLVEQAAAAFERWHGVAPKTAPVIQCLRPRNRSRSV